MHIPSFSDSRDRSIWVQMQLRMRGSSFSEIARAEGVTPNTISAAMHRPNDARERAIADAIGVSQRQLFPERFMSTGKRVHHVREDSGDRSQRNAKKVEAA